MPETPRPSLALPPIMRDGCETIVETYANISFLFVFRFFFSFQRNNIKLEYLYNRKEDWNFSISLRNFFFLFPLLESRLAFRSSVAHERYTKVCGQWNLGN